MAGWQKEGIYVKGVKKLSLLRLLSIKVIDRRVSLIAEEMVVCRLTASRLQAMERER